MVSSIYNRKSFIDRSEFSPSKAETAGYLPPKMQIENMILAGKRLDEARKEQFDFFNGEVDDSFSDPTRTPGFDLADASTLARDVERNLKESAKKRDKDKAEADAKAKAEQDALIEKGRKAVEAESKDG